MCRKSLFAATAVLLALAPLNAHAWGKKKTPESPAAAAPAAKPAQASAPVAPPAKATPAERQMAQRMDPLARAAFWGREFTRDGADLEAAVGLSQALRALGRNDEALATAQQATIIAPANVEANLELARVAIAMNQGFYAIEPLKKVQGLAPHDWRPVSMLGVALEQAQRDDEALAAHLQAVRLAPESPSALANLGMFYAGHGDPAKAESLLRQAVTKPGADITVRQNLVLLLGLNGRFDEAEKLARQDLPPEMVANNMAYLRAAAATGPSAPAARSWDAMRSTQ
jgi:Flp pilus assembly protein TadD